MRDGEGFVGKFSAVDGVPASTVPALEISPLKHEIRNDAVKN